MSVCPVRYYPSFIIVLIRIIILRIIIISLKYQFQYLFHTYVQQERKKEKKRGKAREDYRHHILCNPNCYVLIGHCQSGNIIHYYYSHQDYNCFVICLLRQYSIKHVCLMVAKWYHNNLIYFIFKWYNVPYPIILKRVLVDFLLTFGNHTGIVYC